jgi:hypothetical protein
MAFGLALVLAGIISLGLVIIGINWCAFCGGWHDPDAKCRPPKDHAR